MSTYMLKSQDELNIKYESRSEINVRLNIN
jgi:hypothetical protein